MNPPSILLNLPYFGNIFNQGLSFIVMAIVINLMVRGLFVLEM